MIRLWRFRCARFFVGLVWLGLAVAGLATPPGALAQEGRESYSMGQGEGMSSGRGEDGGVRMSVQPRPQAPQTGNNMPMNVYPQIYTGGPGYQGGQYSGRYQGGYAPGYQPQPGQGGPPVLYVPPDPNDPNSRPRLEYPQGYRPGPGQADQPYLYVPPRQGDPDARPRLEPPTAAPRERRR